MARFCVPSRAKSPFSAGIHNTIEETTPYVVKMTCFTVKIVAPAVRIHNTIEDATPYVAQMTCFTVNIYRNSQHYRESDVPCRQSAVFYHQNDRPEAPGGPPASHGGENRGQAPPKQTPEHGFGGKSLGVTSETQVAQFACGTPILRHWTVKTQHNDGPEAPAGPPASHGSKNPKKNTSEMYT